MGNRSAFYFHKLLLHRFLKSEPFMALKCCTVQGTLVAGEEQKAGSITLRLRFRHPGTPQHHPRLLHASPSPTAGLVLGHNYPKPPCLSHHPGPQEAGSPAKRSFHCPPVAPDHARQSSAPFPLSHWLFLLNRAGTRLSVSCTPRLCSPPGQGRGFCWPHPFGAGPGSQALGS